MKDKSSYKGRIPGYRESILTAYLKTLKVIQSCTSVEHLKGASRLIDNFYRRYIDPVRDLKSYDPDKSLYLTYTLSLMSLFFTKVDKVLTLTK